MRYKKTKQERRNPPLYIHKSKTKMIDIGPDWNTRPRPPLYQINHLEAEACSDKSGTCSQFFWYYTLNNLWERRNWWVKLTTPKWLSNPSLSLWTLRNLLAEWAAHDYPTTTGIRTDVLFWQLVEDTKYSTTDPPKNKTKQEKKRKEKKNRI